MSEELLFRLPDPSLKEALGKLELLIVADQYLTETAKLAHIVLPTTVFAEREGTMTSMEGRVQRIRKAVNAPGQAKSDWMILRDVSARMGLNLNFKSESALFDEMAAELSPYKGLSFAVLEQGGKQAAY
jgi:predicted molibdopterin-dependent oxidoreductase YjgC